MFTTFRFAVDRREMRGRVGCDFDFRASTKIPKHKKHSVFASPNTETKPVAKTFEACLKMIAFDHVNHLYSSALVKLASALAYTRRIEL